MMLVAIGGSSVCAASDGIRGEHAGQGDEGEADRNPANRHGRQCKNVQMPSSLHAP